MGLVLDTGALIAFERGDRNVAALLEVTRRQGAAVRTSSGSVAQAWRSGSRQALLARLLRGVDEHALAPGVSRRVGEALAETVLDDVVDGHVALLARAGDIVCTSDVDDIRRLLGALGTRADVVRC
jgi:hypothetical protein